MADEQYINKKPNNKITKVSSFATKDDGKVYVDEKLANCNWNLQGNRQIAAKLGWCIILKIKLDEKLLAKRVILSAISSIYDLLEFAALLVLEERIFNSEPLWAECAMR